MLVFWFLMPSEFVGRLSATSHGMHSEMTFHSSGGSHTDGQVMVIYCLAEGTISFSRKTLLCGVRCLKMKVC
jgi:hypothetical protein